MNHALGELWPRMMSVAYRILGSVTDAEDAVQEAFVRLLATDQVTSLEGFLVKATSHRCFDRLRARRIRTNHVRLSVPCSAMTPRRSGVEAVEESLSRAFLYMLERLTPVELAVFLLRTAFDFEFVEIAEVLGKATAHTRQILCRARSRLLDSEPRFARTLENADDVAERFVAACRSGDIASIGKMLVEVPGGVRRDESEPSFPMDVLNVSHRPAAFVSDTREGGNRTARRTPRMRITTVRRSL